MILLVALAVSAVGWLSYRNLEQALLPRVLDRIETHSRFVAADLESYVRRRTGDVAGFRSVAALNGLIRARLAGGIDPIDGVLRKRPGASGWERAWLSELEPSPPIRLRFIGRRGRPREIVRVDRSGPNGAVRIVPEAELQRKGDAAFLPGYDQACGRTKSTSRRSIWTGTTESSRHRTCRRCASRRPIFAPDGKPFGIFIVNVDMRPALDRVRSSVRPGESVYVVNGRGDYLVHPDRTREFGSQLGKPNDWRSDFPSLASSLGATRSVAQILPEQGRTPGRDSARSRALGRQRMGRRHRAGSQRRLHGAAAAIRNTSLLVGLIAVLCAAALAVFIARTLTRPIIQLTAAVEGAGRDGPAAIPVDAGGETGVLARAFARVMGEVNAKTAALEHEVQEHRRTEAARDHHASRERLFSAAVESSNDAIVTKSLDGTITGWNPAAERLFGYTAAEAVGQHIDLIVPPTRTEEVHDILRRVGWGETIENYETERLCKDGSLVQVSLSISPIKTPSGAIIGASTTARDITASRRTEHALRQQIEERRRIFDTSQDLILVIDPRGVLVQVSPSAATILGYAPKEMIGRNASEFLHPDDLEISREEMRLARRGKRARNSDSRYIHKDGRIVTLSWMGDMVGAGPAVLLRRPRHDRKPAGAGNAARKRATGARHHRYRARRLRPDRRARPHPELEFAGGKYLRLVAR